MRNCDVTNEQMVGAQAKGDTVTILLPKRTMTRRQALVHAAWLVAVADRDDEFPAYLEAVRST